MSFLSELHCRAAALMLCCPEFTSPSHLLTCVSAPVDSSRLACAQSRPSPWCVAPGCARAPRPTLWLWAWASSPWGPAAFCCSSSQPTLVTHFTCLTPTCSWSMRAAVCWPSLNCWFCRKQIRLPPRLCQPACRGPETHLLPGDVTKGHRPRWLSSAWIICLHCVPWKEVWQSPPLSSCCRGTILQRLGFFLQHFLPHFLEVGGTRLPLLPGQPHHFLRHDLLAAS